jgi:hypothetical protein
MLQEMPGQTYTGPWPALSQAQRHLAEDLKAHVYRLSHQIGPRNFEHYPELCQAADYLQEQLESYGYSVRRLPYETEGQRFENLETVDPNGGPFMVIGAHYDSVLTCPGANDNASAVAGLLELARRLQGRPGFRFVLFTNEEPPFYKTEFMGSWQYVKYVLDTQQPVQSMLCLETVGYYSQAPGSQRTAFPGMVPDVGNFVALVGDVQSASLVKRFVEQWQASIPFPCIGLVPQPEGEAALLQAGMDMSDHACFWEAGIPALMVTDTVFYRYDHYHLSSDTWEKLTYEPFALMIDGLAQVLQALRSDSG